MKASRTILRRPPRGPSPCITIFLAMCATTLTHADARRITENTNPTTDTCAICKEVYTDGIDYMNNDKTMATVLQVIENKCKDERLHFLDFGECVNILEDFYTIALQEIEHSITPESFCKMMRSCPSTEYQNKKYCIKILHKKYCTSS